MLPLPSNACVWNAETGISSSYLSVKWSRRWMLSWAPSARPDWAWKGAATGKRRDDCEFLTTNSGRWGWVSRRPAALDISVCSTSKAVEDNKHHVWQVDTEVLDAQVQEKKRQEGKAKQEQAAFGGFLTSLLYRGGAAGVEGRGLCPSASPPHYLNQCYWHGLGNHQ